MSDNSLTPSTKHPNSNLNTNPKPAKGGGLSPAEREAILRASKVKRFLDQQKALYVLEDSQPRILLNNKLLPLDFTLENDALSALFSKVCQSPLQAASRNLTIQHLRVHANERASKIQLRRFSALSQDLSSVYLPHPDLGKVLHLTSSNIETEANGNNPSGYWMVHPYNDPAEWSSHNDPKTGLELFEKLCVDTQSCSPSMRWLTAMNEAFVPYLRDLLPARFLTVHHGGAQQGKTTAAQRHTLLLGLGEVKGDYSVPALVNQGDIGLLVMDNKEHMNLSQPFIDFCLYLSTGAQSGRSDQSGHVRRSSFSRPVGVITSIEGVSVKEELKARCINIEYDKSINLAPVFRALNEAEIKRSRSLIFSSTLSVIQQFLQTKWEPDCAFPGFEEHFSVLCNLFRITADTLKKPSSWTENTISAWRGEINDKPQEENELEGPIDRIIERLETGDLAPEEEKEISYRGTNGTLFLITPSKLFMWLQSLDLRRFNIPRNPAGLGARISSSKFYSFSIINGKNINQVLGIEARSKETRERFIGLFRPR